MVVESEVAEAVGVLGRLTPTGTGVLLLGRLEKSPDDPGTTCPKKQVYSVKQSASCFQEGMPE